MNEQSGYQVSDSAAQMYEKYATLFMGQFVVDLLEIAALQPGERVLDLACGTGVIARHAAAVVGESGQVTGLDINAGMLAAARAMPPESGAVIKWIEGSATALDLRSASFDAILCQQGLQFFPDRDTALREMLRVLVPGGRVVLSVWRSPSPYNVAVGEALDRFTTSEIATKYRASRTVPNAESLHRMIVAAGFRSVEIHPRTVTIHQPGIEAFVLGHLSSSPVAGAIAAMSNEDRAAFAQHVKTRLRDYASGDGVAYPDEVNAATALK
jgi:ubiquinone/menaquinone biosynthesis C-methylase UbiE